MAINRNHALIKRNIKPMFIFTIFVSHENHSYQFHLFFSLTPRFSFIFGDTFISPRSLSQSTFSLLSPHCRTIVSHFQNLCYVYPALCCYFFKPVLTLYKCPGLYRCLVSCPKTKQWVLLWAFQISNIFLFGFLHPTNCTSVSFRPLPGKG